MALSTINKYLPALSTINKYLEEHPAVCTAMKCAAIGAALVATAAVGGVTVATATAIAGIAVGAAIVAPAAHALEGSDFLKRKPVLQKACKFVRVACETSLAIGAGLAASPHLLGISAAGFVVAKAVQKGVEYKIGGNKDGHPYLTMGKNLGSGIASVCAPLALGSALSFASGLGNIFSSATTPTFAEGGKNVVARTGSALFAASTAAFSGACYLASASLDNLGFKKAASATRVIGHASLAAAAVSASVAAGFAVGEAIYHPSVDDATNVGSASAAVGGLVTGVGVGAGIAGIAAGTGVFVANKYCKDTVTKDMNNAKEIFTTKGKADPIVANKIPPTKDKTEKTDATNTIGASKIPSGSPRSSSASQFGKLKFNGNKGIGFNR
tara:strand:+ start:406 stop:1557 length:1152 start_codon:yes stop_codon:yes gene_type:complete